MAKSGNRRASYCKESGQSQRKAIKSKIVVVFGGQRSRA